MILNSFLPNNEVRLCINIQLCTCLVHLSLFVRLTQVSSLMPSQTCIEETKKVEQEISSEIHSKVTHDKN